ncbi:hypothetical protein MTO96_051849 [Rhipicephalus appendiculatus]
MSTLQIAHDQVRNSLNMQFLSKVVARNRSSTKQKERLLQLQLQLLILHECPQPPPNTMAPKVHRSRRDTNLRASVYYNVSSLPLHQDTGSL